MILIILEECGRTPDKATRDSLSKKFMETENFTNMSCLAGQTAARTQTLLTYLEEKGGEGISVMLLETKANKVTVLGEAETAEFLSKLGQPKHELSSDLALEILYSNDD